MRNICIVMLILAAAVGVLAQQERRPGAPPRGGVPGPPHMGQVEPGMQAPQAGSWIRPHDANQNGILEADEFAAAMEQTFATMDRNNSGILEMEELRPRPMKRMQPPPSGQLNAQNTPPAIPMLPPFFTRKGPGESHSLSKAEFEQHAREIFAEIDENGDGAISQEEAAKHLPPHPPQAPQPPQPPAPPNAEFIGAELRFGDNQVTGQPFSADILIEETKRLFDGSLITRQTRGSVFRDAAGRTRREQPIEMVAGFPVVGRDNKPQMLVFINDFATRSHIFLDMNSKIARRSPLGRDVAPNVEPRDRREGTTDSLGVKTIEGVRAEGKRTTFEIPAGRMGNDKPLSITEEKWYSPELQVVVLSRHVDPIGGEHVFRLVNIKRSEPVAELFTVPSGFRFDN